MGVGAVIFSCFCTTFVTQLFFNYKKKVALLLLFLARSFQPKGKKKKVGK